MEFLEYRRKHIIRGVSTKVAEMRHDGIEAVAVKKKKKIINRASHQNFQESGRRRARPRKRITWSHIWCGSSPQLQASKATSARNLFRFFFFGVSCLCLLFRLFEQSVSFTASVVVSPHQGSILKGKGGRHRPWPMERHGKTVPSLVYMYMYMYM